MATLTGRAHVFPVVVRTAIGRRLPSPPGLEELPAGPGARRFARTWVRELVPLLGLRRPAPRRRLFLIFLDGMGGSTLDRAIADGSMPFLARLVVHPKFRRTEAFSGMPSTTTAFQAGLFYGLRHPDIPGFCWYDRRTGQKRMMGTPRDAMEVEAELAARAGPGLFHRGTTYLSILRGGARNYGSTAGLWPLISGPRLPPLIPADFVGGTWVHLWTAVRVFLRLVTEIPLLLGDILRFCTWTRWPGLDPNYILNQAVVANLLQEMGRSQVLFDLVRGVERMFYCIHDYDEVAHRRGPEWARRTLGKIDRRLEYVVSVAAAAPDPPDVWIITDHGQIPAIPFEGIFGCTLAEWLERTDVEALPETVLEAVGRMRPRPRRENGDMVVVDSGNYAHVYLSREGPLDARQIVRDHAHVLSRVLACPGIGLAVMRLDDSAIAFAGGRRVDPDDPRTIPACAERRALRVFLEDLPKTPSAGDIVLFGSWVEDACVAFTREYASHGGLSSEETSIFLVHPAGMAREASAVSHGADLHPILSELYGPGPDDPA